MSINYAILGILSYKSMTGYDLKKIIQDSAFMPWSGNNNQIYKALTELFNEGLVTNVVQHQESSPTKKIYSITDEGLKALREWVLSPIEDNDVKKPFLLQLAWSSQLTTRELNMLLDGYEEQIKLQLLMEKNKNQDTLLSPRRTPLEGVVWDFINDSFRRSYEVELEWVRELRGAIVGIPNANDANENAVDASEKLQEDKQNEIMRYTIKKHKQLCYVHYNDTGSKLESKGNILDIITALAEYNTQFVALDYGALSKSFVELREGLFETMLQKFSMYHIKSAIIIKEADGSNKDFRASIAESGKFDVLKTFSSIKEAEAWFLSIKK